MRDREVVTVSVTDCESNRISERVSERASE